MRGKQVPPGQPPQTGTDVPYIDGECIGAMAPTATRLRAAIDTAVVAVATVCADFAFNIKWKPWKTEGMVHLNGVWGGAIASRSHPPRRPLPPRPFRERPPAQSCF